MATPAHCSLCSGWCRSGHDVGCSIPPISRAIPCPSGLGGFNGFTKEILGTTKFLLIHWEDCRAKQRLSTAGALPTHRGCLHCKFSTFLGRPFTRGQGAHLQKFLPNNCSISHSNSKKSMFSQPLLYNPIFKTAKSLCILDTNSPHLGTTIGDRSSAAKCHST